MPKSMCPKRERSPSAGLLQDLPPTKKPKQGRSRLDGVRRFVAARRSQAIVPSTADPGSPDSPVVGLERTLAEGELPEPPSNIDGHIHQAERAVFSYVELFGGIDLDLDLKLRILDWKTRVVELEIGDHADEMGSYAARKLTEMVHEARKDVIARVKQARCTDIELRIKVLDLETRVVEKNNMLEGNIPAS